MVTFTSPQTFAPCIQVVPPPVFVVWDNQVVLGQYTARTTPCDSFTITVTVPQGAPDGPHPITLREGNALAGAVLGTAVFTVTASGIIPPPPVVLPPPPPPPYWVLFPFPIAFTVEVPPRLNRAPTCGIDGPAALRVGERVTYRSTSVDPDGDVEVERWRITNDLRPTDRIVERGETVDFWADAPGTYEVLLNIEDNEGAVNSCGMVVVVSS